MIANTDTTPRIGRDIGSTIDQNSRNGPAPSVRAASKISRGRLSKNRVTSRTLNAFAPAGSQTAQKVLISECPTSGGCSTVRYSGTSSTTAGTNSVASTRPLKIGAYFGPQHGQRVAAGRRHQHLHEPRADRDPDRVEELHADADRVPRGRDVAPVPAVRKDRDRRLRVSWVGVIADFSSQSSGPMPHRSAGSAG